MEALGTSDQYQWLMKLLLENTGKMAKLNKLMNQNQYLQTQKAPKLIHKLIIDHFPIAFTLGEHITKLQAWAGLVSSKAAKRMIPK